MRRLNKAVIRLIAIPTTIPSAKLLTLELYWPWQFEARILQTEKAFDRFCRLAKKVVNVPKSEIGRRAKEWREAREADTGENTGAEIIIVAQPSVRLSTVSP